MTRLCEATAERRYVEALEILEGRKNGLGIPRLKSLAMRGYGPAMVALADELDRDGKIGAAGSADWLYYRAFRRGELFAAHNFAIHRLNQGDLQGYRHWLGKAARQGDRDSALELRRFETRFPHEPMRQWRRLRPWRDGD